MPDVTLTEAASEPAAVFSPDRRYRYVLRRRIGMGDRRVLFVMLNPSTADEETNDATIRRCIDFGNRWGYGWLSVCNLYAYRATDPAVLWTVPDPVGPENDARIAAEAERSREIIVAWGANAKRERVAAFLDLAEKSYFLESLWCLGVTAGGQPKHPCRLPKTTIKKEWPGAEGVDG